MCWVSEEKPNFQKGPLKVFKVCCTKNFRDIFSYFKYFKYKIGETYSLDDSLIALENNLCEYEIFKGFHSYSQECIYNPLFNCLGFLEFVTIKSNGRKIRTYERKDSILIMLDCEIPEDGEYCINEYGEIVSNKIKILGIKYE